MKFFFPALSVLFLALLGVARAQEEGGQLAAPPDEIITDFGIEEYLAIPKFSVSIGGRSLVGAKASFTGRGFVSSFQPPSDTTTSNLVRIYNDGNVLPDNPNYSFTGLDINRNSVLYTARPSPAGYTNTWSYLNSAQLRDDGNLDFHSYAVDVVDSGLHEKNPGVGSGIDITFARDMGNLGKHFQWKLIFGTSLTDIKSHTTETLNASITTITDTYGVNLADQPQLPIPPYTGPSFRADPQFDDTGAPIFDNTGVQVVNYIETTIYVTDAPIAHNSLTTSGTVFNQWDLKGAYFTFRIGPSIDYLITDHLRFTLSAGAALVYSGTQYSVEQIYQPDNGDSAVSSTVIADEGKFLPGYYVDASLQYDITDRTAIYAGGTYQDTGSYTQTAALDDPFSGSHASYKAVIDMSSLSGFRMGMTFKF